MTGRLPNFIIAGVMKGGTTSLFSYLAQHPDFFPSSVKETTFFRPFYSDAPGVDPEALSLDDYRRFFVGAGDQPFVFESSPGYINGGGRLARHLDKSLPGLRVAFLLREPVERARSYFTYQKSLLNLPQDARFDDYVAECLAQERRDGKPDWPHRGLWGGRYAELLRDWSDVLGPRMRILFFDELRADSRACVDGLCRWLGARGVEAAKIDFAVENKTRLPANTGLHRLAMAVNERFEPFLRRNRVVKKALRAVYFGLNAASEAPRDAEGLEAARDYFAASNHALQALLQERFPDTALPAWVRDAQAA